MVLFRGRQLAPLLALSHRGVFEHWLSRPYHLARTATLTTMSALDSPSDTASPGAPMLQYADLAATMRAIEEEPARLEKEALMASLLSRAWSLSSDELLACVALATLQLEPSARPLKLGIGDAMVLAAIAEASGAPLETLKAELVHHGDVGILAEERLQGGGGGGGGGVGGKSMPSWTPLTMTEAQAQLLALSSLSGKGESLTLAHFSRPFFPPIFPAHVSRPCFPPMFPAHFRHSSHGILPIHHPTICVNLTTRLSSAEDSTARRDPQEHIASWRALHCEITTGEASIGLRREEHARSIGTGRL